MLKQCLVFLLSMLVVLAVEAGAKDWYEVSGDAGGLSLEDCQAGPLMSGCEVYDAPLQLPYHFVLTLQAGENDWGYDGSANDLTDTDLEMFTLLAAYDMAETLPQAYAFAAVGQQFVVTVQFRGGQVDENVTLNLVLQDMRVHGIEVQLIKEPVEGVEVIFGQPGPGSNCTRDPESGASSCS